MTIEIRPKDLVWPALVLAAAAGLYEWWRQRRARKLLSHIQKRLED